MNKKLLNTVLSVALMGNIGLLTGMTWPQASQIARAEESVTWARAESPQLADNLWQESLTFALLDKHIHQTSTIITLPKGWMATGSVWNHHEMMVRTMGMINKNGASAFILFGPEDTFKKPMDQVDEKTIVDACQPWEKVVASLYPEHKMEKEDPSYRISWQVYPVQLAQELRRADSSIKALRRGRLINFYTLTKGEDDPYIMAMVISDFDLTEYRIKQETFTKMRNRHVKLCFVPQGLDPAQTAADIARTAIQGEEVTVDWFKSVLSHSKDHQGCQAPETTLYNIFGLKRDLESFQKQSYSICTNPATGERVLVPTMSCTVWCNDKKEYLLVNSGCNPNDYQPLDRVDWRRIH